VAFYKNLEGVRNLYEAFSKSESNPSGLTKPPPYSGLRSLIDPKRYLKTRISLGNSDIEMFLSLKNEYEVNALTEGALSHWFA